MLVRGDREWGGDAMWGSARRFAKPGDSLHSKFTDPFHCPAYNVPNKPKQVKLD